MVLKQKRIRNLSKLSNIKKGAKIVIAKTNIENIKELSEKIGFTKNLEIGETVLPRVIGPVTRRNAEGEYIIHRDKEKEIHSRMIEWTYNQWAGRGKTKEVTEYTSFQYRRYPRTFIPPQSIELMITEKNGSRVIISPNFVFSRENEDIIVHTINLFLEIFNECEIMDSNIEPIIGRKVIRLNWEVLPKGEYPWEIQKKRIEPFLRRAKGKNRAVVEKRLEEINKYNPDFTAVGTAGFSGYLVHGFVSKNIYILESIYVNNATYILENDWETLSKLSKSEILNNDLHKARIIHNKNWYKNLAALLA